ncbi:MAG: hypothetical protein KDD55_00195 [Bdellovibrionales bacterium]|nr:hypothetical protein [Bdellovibrionales bacterium]
MPIQAPPATAAQAAEILTHEAAQEQQLDASATLPTPGATKDELLAQQQREAFDSGILAAIETARDKLGLPEMVTVGQYMISLDSQLELKTRAAEAVADYAEKMKALTKEEPNVGKIEREDLQRFLQSDEYREAHAKHVAKTREIENDRKSAINTLEYSEHCSVEHVQGMIDEINEKFDKKLDKADAKFAPTLAGYEKKLAALELAKQLHLERKHELNNHFRRKLEGEGIIDPGAELFTSVNRDGDNVSMGIQLSDRDSHTYIIIRSDNVISALQEQRTVEDRALDHKVGDLLGETLKALNSRRGVIDTEPFLVDGPDSELVRGGRKFGSSLLAAVLADAGAEIRNKETRALAIDTWDAIVDSLNHSPIAELQGLRVDSRADVTFQHSKAEVPNMLKTGVPHTVHLEVVFTTPTGEKVPVQYELHPK